MVLGNIIVKVRGDRKCVRQTYRMKLMQFDNNIYTLILPASRLCYFIKRRHYPYKTNSVGILLQYSNVELSKL